MLARLRPYVWLAPWLVGFAVFFAYPLLATIYFSFFNYDLFTLKFNGLDNYRYFLQDDRAWLSIRNTLWLVVVMVPAQVLFALGVAQLLTKLKAGVGFFRTLFYLPSLVPLAAGTVAFVFLMNPSTGPVNHFLSLVGRF